MLLEVLSPHRVEHVFSCAKHQDCLSSADTESGSKHVTEDKTVKSTKMVCGSMLEC